MNSYEAQERSNQIAHGREMLSRELTVGANPHWPSLTNANDKSTSSVIEVRRRSQPPLRGYTKAVESRLGEAARKLRGHQLFLMDLKDTDATVTIIDSLGEKVTGKIKAQDDDTISIHTPVKVEGKPDAYCAQVIFKHNIVKFYPVVPGVENI